MGQTVLLTSAGMNVKEEILKVLSKPPSRLRLAHIITATKVEENIQYMINEENEMRKLGFHIENLDIEGKTEDELMDLLKDKDIIYVQGGNSFYLLKHVKKSGFDKVAKRLISQGILYIGVSAGSYIACPTIEQATWQHQDRNRFGLTDLTALNLVPFLISAHFTQEDRSIIEDRIKTIPYPVVALYDTQAVLVKNGTWWKIVGQGKKEFFNGFEENI